MIDALCALLLSVIGACASAPPGMGKTIDTVDERGHEGTLAHHVGRVVIIDLCASTVNACNLNARVLDEVQGALAGEPVRVVTLLLDEGVIGQEALRSYVAILGVQHDVLLAGPRVRQGTSVLGETSYVPRLVVLDREGRVRIDDAGGVVSVQGLVERVRPLLR